MQKITLTVGCPNNCSYCYEGKKEFKTLPLPKIIDKEVQFLDMNFLANPNRSRINIT